MAPIAFGRSVAAITANVDTKSMGLTENFFPTLSAIAQKINPAATAIDIVRRLTSDLGCRPSTVKRHFNFGKDR